VLERRSSDESDQVKVKICGWYPIVSLFLVLVSSYKNLIYSFEYISPPPHRTIQSLAETPVFGSEYLHISPPYTPEETLAILQDLRTVKNTSGKTWSPKVIYEPHPRTCEPSQRVWLEKGAPYVNILS
jgi:hypothetical protein